MLIKVAYLGSAGSFSFLAAAHYFGTKTKLVPSDTITDVIKKVTIQKAQYGVIPIENSTTGSIFETYDLLIKHNVFITGEVYLCIHHHLLVKNGTNLADVSNCYSHPQAVAQCQNFLSKHKNFKLLYVADTATAAQTVAKSHGLTDAAIASTNAANLYSLRPICINIEDNARNFTRFAVISKRRSTDGNKVTLILSVKHIPGSLYRALAPIALSGFNLTKIESRPIMGTLWEYLFIVDFELGKFTKHLNNALKQLRQNTQKITILGTYTKGKSYET